MKLKSIWELNHEKSRYRFPPNNKSFFSSPSFFSYKKNYPPVVVFKIITQRNNATKGMDYFFDNNIEDELKSENRIVCNSFGNQITKEEFKKIKNIFKEPAKNKGKICRHHLIFSTKIPPTKSNIENYKNLMVEYAAEKFGEINYDYFLSIHGDTNELHSHIILKTTNRFTNQRFFLRKNDIRKIKEDYAEKLQKQGYDCVAYPNYLKEKLNKEKLNEENEISFFKENKKYCWLISQAINLARSQNLDFKKTQNLTQRYIIYNSFLKKKKNLNKKEKYFLDKTETYLEGVKHNKLNLFLKEKTNLSKNKPKYYNKEL